MKLFVLFFGLFSFISSHACYYDVSSFAEYCKQFGDYDVVISNCTPKDAGYPSDYYISAGCNFPWNGLPVCSTNISGNRTCPVPEQRPPASRQTPEAPKLSCNSIVNVDTQVLTEFVKVSGTDFSLTYSSDRQRGFLGWDKIKVPLSGSYIPNPIIKKFVAEVSVAGKFIREEFVAAQNLSYEFLWNRLNSQNNPVQGSVKATISTSQNYDTNDCTIDAFNLAPGESIILEEVPTTPRCPYQIEIPISTEVFVGSIFKDIHGVGGWDVSINHHYDVERKILFLGTGEQFNTNYLMKGPSEHWVVSPDRSEIFVFNNLGQHIVTKDALTNIHKYLFNFADGKLVKITDKYGNETNFEYSISGEPTSITGPYGAVTSLTTTTNGFLETIRNPANDVHELTYSTSGLLASFKKPNGVTTSFEYNQDGKLISDKSSDGPEINLSFQETLNGLNIFETSASGKVSEYISTTNNGQYVRQDRLPSGFVSTTTTRSREKEKVVQAPNYQYLSYSQDDPRYERLIKKPNMISINDTGQTLYVNLSEEFALSNQSDPFSFSTLKSNWMQNGRIYSSEFNKSTKTITNRSPLGKTSIIQLNPLGDVASMQMASYEPINFTYNTRGSLLTSTQGQSRSTTMTYDNEGYLETIKNALNQTTTFERDALGRVITQTLPDGREIAFAYDPADNLIQVKPPGRDAHLMDYTDIGLTGYHPPLVLPLTNASTTYSYNNDKQLTEIKKADNSVVNYVYDSTTGNLNSIQMPNGDRTFLYNNGYLQSAMSEDFVKRSFTWKGTGIETDATVFNNISSSLFYYYNSELLPEFESLSRGPINWTIYFNYNEDRLLKKVGNLVFNRDNSTGLITQSDLGNLSQFFTYSSNFGELSAIEAVHNGNPVYEESMTRDNLGRIATRTEQYGSSPAKTYSYIYDTSGRLTEVLLNGTTKSKYGYDSNSNRTSQTIDGITLAGGTAPSASSAEGTISVGKKHTCAITTSGVKCWGEGRHGQLGYGNTNNLGHQTTLNNLDVISLGGVAQSIGLGQDFSCALLDDGNVRCWGNNNDGQLGQGNTNKIGDNELPSSAPTVNVGGQVKKLAVGDSHACVVRIDNKVVCWGNGRGGRLGYGNKNNIGDNETPASAGVVNTGTTAEIKDIVVGNGHSCILTNDGQVKCWGKGNSLQLGYLETNNLGDNEVPSTKPFLSFSESISQLAAGGEHTCVITASNNLKCWGRNDLGQLGYGNITNPTALTSTLGFISVGESVKRVRASSGTTCVITTSDKAKCWGLNDVGQLGTGTILNIGDDELPSTIPTIPFQSTVNEIVAGDSHTCAALTSGEVFCWGSGSAGKLGTGNKNDIGDNETPDTTSPIPGVDLGTPPQVAAIEYDGQDRLLKFGTKTFTYNANGDLLTETNSETSETKSFVYDSFGNLKSVTLPNKVIEYKVDSFNRRVAKLVNNTVVEMYIWNSFDQLIGITNGTGDLQARFMYGSKTHVPDYMAKNNIEYQIVSNRLGSPVAVVDTNSGTITQEITYDEYGIVLTDSSPGFMPFGFAGCLYDIETKLCRFGARDYDASIGRWLSKDPILFAGGDTNLYGYVFNDPVNLIDPNGQCVWCAGAAIGAVIGGASGYLNTGTVQGVLIGAGSGALTGTRVASGVIAGGLIGAGANIATQLAQGTSLAKLNWPSVAASGVAGGLGALGGIKASKALQVPFGVLGRAPGQAGRLGQVSNSIISSSVGGALGSGFDLLGGRLTNSCQ